MLYYEEFSMIETNKQTSVSSNSTSLWAMSSLAIQSSFREQRNKYNGRHKWERVCLVFTMWERERFCVCEREIERVCVCVCLCFSSFPVILLLVFLSYRCLWHFEPQNRSNSRPSSDLNFLLNIWNFNLWY